jgi:hypothetical protein
VTRDFSDIPETSFFHLIFKPTSKHVPSGLRFEIDPTLLSKKSAGSESNLPHDFLGMNYGAVKAPLRI